MMDVQFSSPKYVSPQLSHRYGERVHLLHHPLSLALLAKLCDMRTEQPQVTRLLIELYRTLVYEAIAAEFPKVETEVRTRMYPKTSQGVWRGYAVDCEVKAVVVSLARAGLVPSQFAYDFLHDVLPAKHIRQDHLALSRTVDTKGQVVGAELFASKIGGRIDDCFLLIPDPMGATGSTVGQVLEHYQQGGYGHSREVIALHLIVTPEYLRFVCEKYPHVKVYALRLDRGLSSADVLGSPPGERWEEERGLTSDHYIVPGAGGLGEVLNNSFV